MLIKQAIAAFVVASVSPMGGDNTGGIRMIGASAAGGIEEGGDFGHVGARANLGRTETIDLVGAAAGADVEDGGALRKTLYKLAELSEKADAYQNADVVARHVGGNEEGEKFGAAAAAPVDLKEVDAEALADPLILKSDAGYGSNFYGIPGALKKLSGFFKSDGNVAAADLTEITSEEEEGDSVDAAVTASVTVIKSDALDNVGEDLNAQIAVKRVKLRGADAEKDGGNSNEVTFVEDHDLAHSDETDVTDEFGASFEFDMSMSMSMSDASQDEADTIAQVQTECADELAAAETCSGASFTDGCLRCIYEQGVTCSADVRQEIEQDSVQCIEEGKCDEDMVSTCPHERLSLATCVLTKVLGCGVEDSIKSVKLRGVETQLTEHDRAKSHYAHTMTKHSLDQMHQDYQDSVLNGDPEKELPSYDEVRRMFEKMYDLFHLTDTDGTTNSSISEEDALMFINGRMSANPWSSTFHEVDVCKVMFLADDTNLTIEDESAMDLTLEDMEAVGQACYHASVSSSLRELGFNPDTFCPHFQTILPLQFQLLGEMITQNVTSFCSYLVDTSFETAGEPECYRRMEEVTLNDAIRQGVRYAFPSIVETSTFEESFMAVCQSHGDTGDCAKTFLGVVEVSTSFEDGNATMISYLSQLCDAFSLPLPHPNETIKVRYADKHVSHIPGGKTNIKIRHAVSDLFNYVGHYKHGFMNQHGRYIDHPTDTLLDPESDFVKVETGTELTCKEAAVKLNQHMDCEQKGLYCTGLAFSVGVGAEISAGPLSIGGGIDFGFGIQNDTADVYEETFVWGICGSRNVIEGEIGDVKNNAKKADTPSADVGFSFGVTAGGWTNTGHIPGFAQTISAAIKVTVVEAEITIVKTFTEWWRESNGYHGFLLSISASFPPEPVDVSLNEAACYGETIVSATTLYPINKQNRESLQICGPNIYSFNIHDTGAPSSDTATGLSLYYYKTKYDWDHRVNRIWIVHYHGNDLNGGKITYMGYGNHFTTAEVYGVGIAAHGEDAYMLGTATVTQNIGGGKWVDKWKATELNLCVSTNDPGCYPNIELQVKDAQKGTKGNDNVFWRSGNQRVPYAYRKTTEEWISLSHTEDFPLCDWKYNFGCGGGRTITYNPCGSWNGDKVMGIGGSWENGCNACGNDLKNRGLIHSGFKCAKDAGNTGIWLNYNPVKKYEKKSCTIKMKFDSGYGRHGNNIDNIASGFSWEKACEAMKAHLYAKKYIESGAVCSKSTVIWLEYEPKPDWYVMSSNTGANTNDAFKCQNRIANKGSWCNSGDIGTHICPFEGLPYLTCSSHDQLMACSDGKQVTSCPTAGPTLRPTNSPTKKPTKPPTNRPTNFPTKRPTPGPTYQDHNCDWAAEVYKNECKGRGFQWECADDFLSNKQPVISCPGDFNYPWRSCDHFLPPHNKIARLSCEPLNNCDMRKEKLYNAGTCTANSATTTRCNGWDAIKCDSTDNFPYRLCYDGKAYKEDECSPDEVDVCTTLARIAFKPDSPNYDEANAQVFKDSCSELNKEELPSHCSDKTYNVDLLYIQGPHFLLVGTLGHEASRESTCPEVVAFATVTGEKVSFSFNRKDLMHKFTSHNLGTASLDQLFDAEETAKSISESEFDLEKNTCVHYAGNLWRALDFDETNELASFLSDNIASDPTFAKMWKSKPGAAGFLAANLGGKAALQYYVESTVNAQLNIVREDEMLAEV